MSGISWNNCSWIVAVISLLLLIQFEVSNKAEAHFLQFRKCILHSYLICTGKILFDDLHFFDSSTVFCFHYFTPSQLKHMSYHFKKKIISKQWRYIKAVALVLCQIKRIRPISALPGKDMALILSLRRCIFTHGSRHGTTPSYLSQRESERKRESQQGRWGGGEGGVVGGIKTKMWRRKTGSGGVGAVCRKKGERRKQSPGCWSHSERVRCYVLALCLLD